MSLYRNAVWFYKGYTQYTRSGYDAYSKQFVESDLEIDCTGKVYMITGANSGIGKSITQAIAKRGGTVHMVCRNKNSAEEVKTELINRTNNKNIYVHILDVSKPREVCQFARNFLAENQALDVLVNNAGCMVPRSLDENSIEINFATNSLAPFLLTKLLKPILHKSNDARVINVSSGGMLLQKLNIDDPQGDKMNPFDATMAYAQHKRQQVVMTEAFAKEDDKILYSVMHPGWADTPAVRSAMPDFYNKMKDKLRTADQGADTAIWLAISKSAVKAGSGKFFQDRVTVPTHLPLAWTKSSEEDNKTFISILNNYLNKFNS